MFPDGERNPGSTVADLAGAATQPPRPRQEGAACARRRGYPHSGAHARLRPRLERGAEPARRPRGAPPRASRTPTCSSSTTARPTAPPTSPESTAPRCSRSARTAGSRPVSPPARQYAAEHGYDFCGRVDADGQHPPAELRRLLELVSSGACDVAVGSRFVSGDGYEEFRYKTSPARRLGTGAAAPLDGGRARPAVPGRDERHVRGRTRRRCPCSRARTRAARPRSRRSCG